MLHRPRNFLILSTGKYQQPLTIIQYRMRSNNWLKYHPEAKRTIRSELQRIPQYTQSPKNRRHGSFYMVNTKKARLEEQRNTEIQRNNRMLYEKIRKIMIKGRTRSQNRSQSQMNPSDELHPVMPKDSPPNGKMMLTFVKLNELPRLTPPIQSYHKPNTTRSNLSDILEHRSKYIDGYFQSIRRARDELRNKPTEHLEKVVAGKWTVEGLIYDQCVVLKGICPERELTKKYPYSKVAGKVRGDYQQWVKDKFSFEV